MALKGDLESIDLAQVFQMLTLSEKKGTLEIKTPKLRTQLMFHESGLIYAYDEYVFPDKVLARLIRHQLLDDDQLQKAWKNAEARSCKLLDLLVETRVIDEADFEFVFREQMEEEVFDLFFAKGATFEFLEGQEPRGQNLVVDERFVLPVQGLIMDAARRVDEWNYITDRIPSDHCVFEIGGPVEVPPDAAGVDFNAVAECVDGMTSAAGIVERTKLSRFEVFKGLAVLKDSRCIFEVPAEILWERAQKELTDFKSEVGLSLLERALELEFKKIEAFTLAARANQEQGYLRRATLYYSLVAQTYDENSQPEKAATARLQVRRLVSTNLETRVRLYRYYLTNPKWFEDKNYDPLSEVADAAFMLHFVGRTEEADELLLDAHDAQPDHWKGTQVLSQIGIEIGVPKTGVAILEKTAELYLQKRNWPQAARLFRQIRSIDAKFENLDTKLAQCQQELEKQKTRGRRLVRLAMTVAVLGLLEGSYFAYNHYAANALQELRSEELALHGEFPTAIADLATVRDKFPVTISSMLASSRITDLKERQERYEAARAEQTERYQEEVKRRQKRAERAYEEAVQFAHSGRYPQALEQFHRSLDLAMDESWLREVQLELKITEMEGYLGAADQLFQTWVRQMEVAAYESAHAAATRLMDEYPLSPRTDDVTLPVNFETRPAGAVLSGELLLDAFYSGELVTPVLVQFRSNRRGSLKLSREGYVDTTLDFDPTRRSKVLVRLKRIAPVLGSLHAEPTTEMVCDDNSLVVNCKNGVLRQFDYERGEVVWTHKLPPLQDFVASPIKVSDRIVALTAAGDIYFFDLAGDVVVSQKLAGTPTGSGSVYRGVVVVPVKKDAGRFALAAYTPGDGKLRWVQEYAGDLVVGPIACKDGFLLALADGTARRISGLNGSTLQTFEFDNPVTMLKVGDERIWAATADGVLWSMSYASARLERFTELFVGRSVRAIDCSSLPMIVVVGADVVSLSRNGELLRQRRGVAAGPYVLNDKSGLYLSNHRGEVARFDRSKLEIRELYALEQAPVSGIKGKDFPIFVTTDGGVIQLTRDDQKE